MAEPRRERVAATAPGLRLVDFALGGSDALGELERRIDESQDGTHELDVDPQRLSISDPDGHALAFSA